MSMRSARAVSRAARPRLTKLARPMRSRSASLFSGKARRSCSRASRRWRGTTYQASHPSAAPAARGRVLKEGGGRAGERHLAQGRQVVDVVAHERGLVQRDAQLRGNALDRVALRAASPDDVIDGKLPAALLHELSAAARQDGVVHAPVQGEQAQPVPVADVEGLEGLAFLAVVEPPVGHRSVHVEDDETDALQQRAGRAAGHQPVRAPRIRRTSATSASQRGEVSELGPSLSAWSGSSWTSQKSASIPTAAAARASTGARARSPPVEVPCDPGRWTEWVASKQTGANLRIVTRARMSTTRL